jgi:hypothetical protein
MDLQSIFYTVGIIFMVIFAIIGMAVILAFFAIRKLLQKMPVKTISILNNVFFNKNQIFKFIVGAVTSLLLAKFRNKGRKD